MDSILLHLSGYYRCLLTSCHSQIHECAKRNGCQFVQTVSQYCNLITTKLPCLYEWQNYRSKKLGVLIALGATGLMQGFPNRMNVPDLGIPAAIYLALYFSNFYIASCLVSSLMRAPFYASATSRCKM